METFEGKCDPQRLAKLEKRVGAADTPQESFHKSQSFYCLKISKFQRNFWKENFVFSIRKFAKHRTDKNWWFYKNQKFIIINLSNDDKATIVATSLVTPDLMAQDSFTNQNWHRKLCNIKAVTKDPRTAYNMSNQKHHEHLMIIDCYNCKT